MKGVINYEETKNAIIGGLLILFFCLFAGAAVLLYSTSRELNQTRGLLDTAREHIELAEAENRIIGAELDECKSRLEQCYNISEELGESVGKNIGNIRECIELVEEIRYEIACLSYYSGYCSSDSIYQRVDSWLQDNGVEY